MLKSESMRSTYLSAGSPGQTKAPNRLYFSIDRIKLYFSVDAQPRIQTLNWLFIYFKAVGMYENVRTYFGKYFQKIQL